MNRRSRVLVLSFAAIALSVSGCTKSKQMGSLSVYTRVRSDARGPWANTVVVVNGYGFAPHKRIDLSFKGLPVEASHSNSWHTDEPIAAMTDANGSFSWSITVKSASTAVASWSRYIAALPPLDYYADPNTEVTVTAKEHWRPYFAQTTIKAGDLIGTPYNGGVAAADTSKAPAPAAAK